MNTSETGDKDKPKDSKWLKEMADKEDEFEGFINAGSPELFERHLKKMEKTKRKTCPCEFGSPCDHNCPCGCSYMSGGCMRCCRGGSEEQQKACADRLIQQEQDYRQLLKFVHTIQGLEADSDSELFFQYCRIRDEMDIPAIIKRGHSNGYI